MNTRRMFLPIAAASMSVTLCFAQAVPKPGPAATPAAGTVRVMTPAARSNMLARTGGLVQSPVIGPAILFLNTQKRVPAASLREATDQIQKMLRLPCMISDQAPTEPVADAAKALANAHTAAVIVICDAANQPSLLIAPESRWALVNVAALGGSGVSDQVLAERVQKETWRAFGYLMGAANSNFEHCLLKPVLAPADLDALKTKSICPEPFNKIMMQAQRMGMKPTRTTTYRKAVEEGWAPAPTNEIQRAICAEVKKAAGK
jgi:hypothetical protein